jgi:sulfate transport system permease protein
MPLRSEIAPLLIVIKLQQFDYGAAAAIAVAMLTVSLCSLVVINLVQLRLARRGAR